MKTTADFPYVRLRGTFRGFVRRASLWEGGDHLLSVTGSRFREEYRRFYYRDIEAIVFRKCPRAGSIGVWAVTALAWLIAALSAFKSNSPIVWGIAGLFAAVLIARLMLSLRYSCRCYIQTAVSREELPSLVRIWTAQKTLASLRSKIETAQGRLPDELGSLRAAFSEHIAQAAAEAIQGEAAGVKESGGREWASLSTGVKLAAAAFVFLLADAFQSFWFLDAPAHSKWLTLYTIFLALGEVGTIVPAMVCVHRSKAFRSLRNLLLVSLAFVGLEAWLSLNLNQFIAMGAAVRSAPVTQSHVWHWVQVIAGSGLILILLNRDTYQRGELSNA